MVPLFGYYFHGGYYPVGGSGRLADALVEAIEARGGEVRLKTRVARILVDEGRAAGVALADGTRVAANAVVANADLRRTFLELVDARHLPQDFRARIAAATPAPSAFMVHLGVDYVPDCRPANFMFGEHAVGVEVLSRVDPSAAPTGHSTVGIIKLLTNAEAREWFPSGAATTGRPGASPANTKSASARSAIRMIAAAETVLPGLSDHIVHRSEASPVTYARYDLASAGAIYGVARLGPPEWRQEPDPRPRRRGRATHGPGVEAVVISGACAADALVPGLAFAACLQRTAGGRGASAGGDEGGVRGAPLLRAGLDDLAQVPLVVARAAGDVVDLPGAVLAARRRSARHA